MGYTKDLSVILAETWMEDFCWSGSEGTSIKWEDCEQTSLASREAYQEELADRSIHTEDKSSIVKAKIARFLEHKQAKETRRA